MIGLEEFCKELNTTKDILFMIGEWTEEESDEISFAIQFADQPTRSDIEQYFWVRYNIKIADESSLTPGVIDDLYELTNTCIQNKMLDPTCSEVFQKHYGARTSIKVGII
jgi:hypothetical protein